MGTRKVEFHKGTATEAGTFFNRRIHLKELFTLVMLLVAIHSFGQTKTELEISKLSKDFFRWEIAVKMDSLENLLDDRFVVVNSKGLMPTRSDYLLNIKEGRPVHNSIDVEESKVTIFGKTAILAGKCVVIATMNGNKSTTHLSYTEVFENKNKRWKMIALHACKLPD